MNSPDLSERARQTIVLTEHIEAAGGRNQPSAKELADTLKNIREVLNRSD